MMSRPQGLSLPATLPWPPLFTSILEAILSLPSRHYPDTIMSVGGGKGIRLLAASPGPVRETKP